MIIDKITPKNLSAFRVFNIVDYRGYLGFDRDVTIKSIDKNVDDREIYRLERVFGENKEYDAQKSEIIGIELRDSHLQAAGFIRDPKLVRYTLNGITVGSFFLHTGNTFMNTSGILTKILIIPSGFPDLPDIHQVKQLHELTYLHELQNYAEDLNAGIDFYPVNHYGLKI
jgi:hypothetical protein